MIDGTRGEHVNSEKALGFRTQSLEETVLTTAPLVLANLSLKR